MRYETRILMLASISVWFSLMVLGCAEQPRQVERFGMAIGLKTDGIDEYKRLHADVWPDVLRMIRECNIHNYSIYLAEIDNDEYCLFGYFEYTGEDFKKDMEKMKADPATRRWWKHTDPLQFKLPAAGEDEWWHNLQEVFHAD